MNKPIWFPSTQRIASSTIHEFSLHIAAKYSLEISSYQDLHIWSINNPEAFWQEIWQFCSLKGQLDTNSIIKNPDKLISSIWFEGSQLNFAENLLSKDNKEPAIISYSEGQGRKTLSWQELKQQVSSVSNYFESIGIKEGDRVAAVSANVPEAIVCMLATASIGAIWSSCSPDFGSRGLLDRFGQIEPKVLIATTAYNYNGKKFETEEKIKFLKENISSIEEIISLPNELIKAVSYTHLTLPTICSV